jgi:hypothetical protein
MQKVFFSKEELSVEYDIWLLEMEQESPWFSTEKRQDPELLKGIIEQWHRLGIMSFSISADGTRFKKDFNVNNEVIINSLKTLKHEQIRLKAKSAGI